jgi:hypothetical protein
MNNNNESGTEILVGIIVAGVLVAFLPIGIIFLILLLMYHYGSK